MGFLTFPNNWRRTQNINSCGAVAPLPNFLDLINRGDFRKIRFSG